MQVAAGVLHCHDWIAMLVDYFNLRLHQLQSEITEVLQVQRVHCHSASHTHGW